MSEQITLAEVMQRMRERGPDGERKACDLEFVKADRKTGKAGELRKLENARLLVIQESALGVTVPMHSKAEPVTVVPAKVRRDPNHDLHDTINLITEKGAIVKAHVRLLTRFNGQPIIW